jgi:serine/threonine-protein kinase RsbW
MAATLTLTLPGDVHAVSHARTMVEFLLTRLGITRECREDVGLIISEACTNAVTHTDRGGDIDVRISVGQHDCVIDVGNSNGLLRDTPVRAALPEPLAENGRGLPIISALTDAARIRHEPGWVFLHTVKRIVRNADRS